MKKFFVHFLIPFYGILLIYFSSSVFAQAPENIYQNGKSAFDKGDYLTAVKFLFAYQRLVEGNIDQSLKDIVNSAIQYCDEQILLAIRTKEDLDKYGHITEVTIESIGKADVSGSQNKTRKYQKPTSKYVPKPLLPPSAPKVQSIKEPFPQVKKALRLVTPLKKVDTEKKNEELEKQLADLEKKYKLLQTKFYKETESYNSLRERYRRLLEKYKALRDQ